MARGRTARRGADHGIFWPGYVDVLSTLLLVFTFLLSIFMLAQYFVSQESSGKDQALRRLNRQIADALPDAELVILPVLRHAILLEAAEQVAPPVLDFLRCHSGS